MKSLARSGSLAFSNLEPHHAIRYQIAYTGRTDSGVREWASLTRKQMASTLGAMADKSENGKATRFQPGHPGGPGRGGGKGRVPLSGRRGGSNGPAVPQQLKDMRKVYKTEKDGGNHPSDSPGESTCRKLCRDNPQQFLALLAKLEKEYKETVDKWKKETQENKPKQDAATDELVLLIDRLLDEWEEWNG